MFTLFYFIHSGTFSSLTRVFLPTYEYFAWILRYSMTIGMTCLTAKLYLLKDTNCTLSLQAQLQCKMGQLSCYQSVKSKTGRREKRETRNHTVDTRCRYGKGCFLTLNFGKNEENFGNAWFTVCSKSEKGRSICGIYELKKDKCLVKFLKWWRNKFTGSDYTFMEGDRYKKVNFRH